MSLLDEVKEKLRVTWGHEDERLKQMIADSQAAIDGLAGCGLDYEAIQADEKERVKRLKGLARALLLNRVFYEYNNQLHDFEKNYQAEILRLQLFVAGDAYVSAE